jgi:phosphatidylglycerol:prolipoprotein diacylglycerol transferase
MLPLAYWVHNLSPFVPFLRFSDTIGVRWYGLAYVAGFIGGVWLFQRYSKKGRFLLPADKAWDLIVALVVGVMVGGRLGSFLLYHPQDLVRDPLSFFRVWEGGMASHGGFIGVAFAVAWYAHSQRIPSLHLADVVVSAAPLGLFFGRIANFINGELWGKPADVPWAMIFPMSPEPLVPRHPSQLYEALLEGLLLLAYLQWRFWKSPVVSRTPGRLSGEFLIGYSLVRIFGEIFREPDATLILGLSRGTFYSFFALVAGICLVALARRSSPLPSTPSKENSRPKAST